MGISNEYLIKKDDYRKIIVDEMHKIGAVETCIYCGAEYLTGKEESYIYATITNIFKENYGKNYDNKLMKEIIEEKIRELFYGHSCKK